MRRTLERNIHQRELIKRALVQAGVMAAGGAGLLVVLRHHGPGLAVLALAAFVGVCGLCAPKVFLALEGGNRAVARAVGIALTWVLLTLVYVAYFIPGRLLLVLLRRDPLGRKIGADAPTYWVLHRSSKLSEPYRRQY